MQPAVMGQQYVVRPLHAWQVKLSQVRCGTVGLRYGGLHDGRHHPSRLLSLLELC